jgi:aspartate racemase
MAAASDGFRRIGVLGGMGVEATLELMKRVHAATEAQDDQDHVPMIVDMNPQVPSRIRHVIEKNGPDPGPVMAQMAARLELAGAEVLAMPCNTAHLYAAQIEERVGIALPNMPQLACAQAAQGMERGGIVGILASPATNSSGLFEGFLTEHGLISAYPENEASILASIRSIKKSGPTQSDINLLETEAAALVMFGAERVIVGCSEFSLVSDRIQTSVRVLDTLDVLVAAIVEFSGVRVKPLT